ncbi:hypothetical protein GW17_00037733 [Ensete ventricosum]|nr:hypothetical protein GW17_00037733 [Ensete ventricosum]
MRRLSLVILLLGVKRARYEAWWRRCLVRLGERKFSRIPRFQGTFHASEAPPHFPRIDGEHRHRGDLEGVTERRAGAEDEDSVHSGAVVEVGADAGEAFESWHECCQGPEIRTGFLKDGKPIKLKEGQEITITTDYSIKGDENVISMSYKKLPVDLKPGNTILCSDGTITLTVESCDPEAGTVKCRCQNTATLGERKNVNLPGVVVDLPTLTEKDKEDIMGWGVPNNIDMIAVSFVRKGSDLVTVRQFLGPHAKHIKLMSKMMIYKCNLVGKPVVTATQMLESMIKSPRPTRAEATDVANAVLDGTDCVMLSGESAAGAYPELAVKIMARICIQAESSLDYKAIFKEMIRSAPLPMSPLESLASSAVRTANKAKAKLIVVLTRGGTTAKLVAKYRPSVPILSVVVPVLLTTDSFDWSVSDESPARQSLIYRGLIPLLAEGSVKATDSESTEVILQAALKSAVEQNLCEPGDAVVALHRIGVASVIKICIVK